MAVTEHDIVFAYNHSEASPTGQNLYYSVDTINGEASLCYGQAGWTSGIEGNLVIPDSVSYHETKYPVTSILSYVFSNCALLTSVTIPRTIKEINHGAFYNCGHLNTINYNADSCTYMGFYNNYVFEGCNNLTVLNIGDNVKMIPNYAFTNSSSLTSINWGCSIVSIGMSSFKGCTNITSICISSPLTSIDAFAFENCTSLISVSLPNTITTMGTSVFRGCSSLSLINIPTSLTAINGLFDGCASLSSIEIPNLVTRIEGCSFRNCSSLSSIILPNSINYIGMDAFRNCTSLSSINIPDSLEIIWDNTFYECNSLTTIVIPSSVVQIRDRAFYGCSSLNSVYLMSATSPVLGTESFDSNEVGRLFYVSCDSYNSYMGSSFWMNYSEDIVSNIFITVGTINETMGTSRMTEILDNNANCDSSTVVIQATALHGYHFVNWSNGRITNPDTITIVGDSVVVANFAPDTFCVYASTNDTNQGFVLNAVNMTAYLSTITLVATPKYGFHFTIWSDGNTDNPRTIEVTRDSLFTAHFDYNQYAITLDVDTNIQGSVIGGGLYNYLSEQTITATANYGYHFAQWNDGDTSNPRIITLTRDTAFAALFAKNRYSVIVTSADTIKGNVTGGDWAEYLDNITLTATPNYGYHFTSWNDGDTSNPRIVEVTKDSLFTAYFDCNQYAIILDVDTIIRGTVAGDGEYSYLTEQTITATANYGYHFVQWNDGDTANPRIIMLTQDTSFSALFERNSYTVSVLSDDTVKGYAGGDATMLYLDSVTISAISNYGYHFAQWNDGSTENPRIIQVTANQTYIAQFDNNQYSIALNVDALIHGTVIGTGLYNYLSEQPITAIANYGYHFSQWSDGDTNNPRMVTLTQDTSFTALFAKNYYTLTLQNNDTTLGTIVGGGTYDYLDTILLVATAAEHHHFVRWDDGNTDNPRQYVVIGDTVLTAIFAIDTHHVSVVSNNIAYGNAIGDGDFEYGTPATVTATAYSGYRFARWSNGDTHNPYTFAVLQDIELTAIFEDENEGIDDVETINAKIYTHNGKIVVEATGVNDVWLYDESGRLIQAIKQSSNRTICFDAPASGTYMIKIGDYPARKVVVIK